MSDPDSQEVTKLLNAAHSGNPDAADQLLQVVYRELHGLAASYMRRERQNHTLQPTALVNEAYMKLLGPAQVEFRDRGHFFVVAARQMRRILVDHARNARALKRGAGEAKVELNDVHGAARDVVNEDLVAVDEALARLEKVDRRASQVVELKYFGGLSDQEAAEALQISFPTLRRDWEFARAFLLNQLKSSKGTP